MPTAAAAARPPEALPLVVLVLAGGSKGSEVWPGQYVGAGRDSAPKTSTSEPLPSCSQPFALSATNQLGTDQRFKTGLVLK